MENLIEYNNTFFEYQVYIFDLDDTIYDETQYLFAAYKEIANYTASIVGGDMVSYEHFLIKTFKTEGRVKLFDKFRVHFNLEKKIALNDLLYILKHVDVPLYANEKIKNLINQLIYNQKKIYILTNGNIIQQQNKIQHLDIYKFLSHICIIYANKYFPKPSPVCINMILEKEDICSSDVIMIGDSSTDNETALNAGVDFINVRKITKNSYD